MMEDATLARIEASLVRTSVANEAISSHELISGNEQVQSNVVTIKEH
jgi:hypothetical protein